MKKNILFNALISIFIVYGVISFSDINYIRNPEKRPLRTSPYVTEVNLQFEG